MGIGSGGFRKAPPGLEYAPGGWLREPAEQMPTPFASPQAPQPGLADILGAMSGFSMGGSPMDIPSLESLLSGGMSMNPRSQRSAAIEQRRKATRATKEKYAPVYMQLAGQAGAAGGQAAPPNPLAPYMANTGIQVPGPVTQPAAPGLGAAPLGLGPDAAASYGATGQAALAAEYGPQAAEWMLGQNRLRRQAASAREGAAQNWAGLGASGAATNLTSLASLLQSLGSLGGVI